MAILRGFPPSSSISSWCPPPPVPIFEEPQPKRYSVEELRIILSHMQESITNGQVRAITEFLDELEDTE